MINHNLSVHLQDFPDVSFISDNDSLIKSMDLVRDICSSALFIRDQRNLRVRMPIKKLTIIGRNSQLVEPFIGIIADEINVKEVELQEDISSLAELQLKINFKKIGTKYGSKVKDITLAMKSGDWKKNICGDIEIAGNILTKDEFELKLMVKDHDSEKYAISAIESDNFLISLDIEVTQDLLEEGIARDIVRAIQQNRKEADLEISNRIDLSISSKSDLIIKAAKNHKEFIVKQVLANSVSFKQEDYEFCFENKIDDGELLISFKVSY